VTRSGPRAEGAGTHFKFTQCPFHAIQTSRKTARAHTISHALTHTHLHMHTPHTHSLSLSRSAQRPCGPAPLLPSVIAVSSLVAVGVRVGSAAATHAGRRLGRVRRAAHTQQPRHINK
jgi:hypothetical protein